MYVLGNNYRSGISYTRYDAYRYIYYHTTGMSNIASITSRLLVQNWNSLKSCLKFAS